MPSAQRNSNLPAAGGSFPTTHWSVVLAAGQTVSTQSTEALARLCEAYWYPLYAFIRRRGADVEQARDLTQEFFSRLLAGSFLESADPLKGRFRTFLLTALTRFLSRERDRNHALKRGGACAIVSWDAQTAEDCYHREPFHELTPERIFERRWALTLLEQALDRLRKEYMKAGKAELFEQLLPFLSEAPHYGAATKLAAEARLPESTARVWVHRLRRRYGELLRETVAQTVATPEEVDAELRHIIGALGD